jgi:hypothetical protein
MNTTKNIDAKFKLTNFDFKSHEMNLIHRQFTGERTQFISTIDELLRCWAMADSSNPKIQFDYALTSRVQDGKTVTREQLYRAEHASVFFRLISEPMDMIPGVALKDPKQLIKLYDLAFSSTRSGLPAHTVASYFTLREAVARLTEFTTAVDVDESRITVFITDGADDHVASLNLKLFGSLTPFAEQINGAGSVE